MSSSEIEQSNEGRRRRSWRAVLVGGAGVVVGALGGLGIAEALTPTVEIFGAVPEEVPEAWSWLSPRLWDLVLSPGFGGTAAFLAAGLAFLAASRGLNHARAQAQADRLNALDDRDEDRWWEMYRMVYEKAPEFGDAGAILALEALDEMAQTNVQDSFMIVLTERLSSGQTHGEEEQ